MRLHALPHTSGTRLHAMGVLGTDTLGCCSRVPQVSIPSRIEMHNFGVKVSVIEPGYFKTMITNVENLGNNFQACWEKLPAEIKESYGEIVSLLKLLQKGYNSDLSLVTNCMEHALTSLHPRSRYSAGWDAKLLYLPLSYLPSALTDALFTMLYPKSAGKA
uniref:Uncharacterized protein n=1 Tax=Zonotrichia albicollis TaxID=44394 RepID=A0A8D2M3L0_ZONAL